MKTITKKDIVEVFEKLGVKGREAVVHSSYRNLGEVEGGPMTVVEGLLESFSLVMTPATSYRSVAKCPDNDRPLRNGCDYGFYDNWGDREVFPFNPKENSIDKKMGIISRLLTELPTTHRSATPWHSWSANGIHASTLAKNADWNDTDKPLKRLIERDGLCVMLGVNLSTCSAIHIAEELVGRKHFIRWCMDYDGSVRRVEAQGCGQGFNNLLPYCEHFIKKATLGNAEVLVFNLKDMLKEATALIKKNPLITTCSPDCIRCRDTREGGPIDPLGEQNGK